MNRTADLVETLKQYLKAKGITYKQLAKELELSEPSVKRLFSKQTFSLSRLEDVCRILDIDFFDLVLMDKERSRNTLKRLTIEQEQILVNDEKLLIFLYFLNNGWTVSLITEEYEYSEIETIQMLSKLEKMGILELHPNNHVRMLISKNEFWQTNGPLWQAYRNIFTRDFMDSSFGLPNERLVFSPGQFSEGSLKIIRKKIDNLVKEYNRLAEMDATLPLKGRHSTGLFIGFRPWVFTRIADLHRRNTGGNRRG
jgi:transcriptional regulator with XRE-family HTH domain